MDTPLQWTILGVGVAGRARAAAISADPRAHLRAVHRGRFASSTGAKELPFDEAVSGGDVVAVCSPDALHELHVRAALTAGRHVVVEFPLATGVVAARGLLELAARVGRTLHVAHIELLSGTAMALRARVSPGSVTSASVHHSRRGPGDEDTAGLGYANVARLHRLVDFAGPVAAVEAAAASVGRLDARLRMATGAPVDLRFEVGPDLPRRTRIDARTPGGTYVQFDRGLTFEGHPVPLPHVGPLFEADQRAVTARILDGAPPYVADERLLHVLEIAEELRVASRAR